MADMVNHPPHYTSHPSGVECIDVTEHYNFCVGNAIKYLWRAGLKNDAIEDLKKARWYVDREIQRLTRGEPESEPEMPAGPELRQWDSLSDVAPGVYVVYDYTGRKWHSYCQQEFWMTFEGGPSPWNTKTASTDHLGPFTEFPPEQQNREKREPRVVDILDESCRDAEWLNPGGWRYRWRDGWTATLPGGGSYSMRGTHGPFTEILT